MIKLTGEQLHVCISTSALQTDTHLLPCTHAALCTRLRLDKGSLHCRPRARGAPLNSILSDLYGTILRKPAAPAAWASKVLLS